MGISHAHAQPSTNCQKPTQAMAPPQSKLKFDVPKFYRLWQENPLPKDMEHACKIVIGFGFWHARPNQ